MTDIAVPVNAKHIEVAAVVVRACQKVSCPHFQTQDCQHTKKEDLGTIAYWDKNPLKMLVHRLSKLF